MKNFFLIKILSKTEFWLNQLDSFFLHRCCPLQKDSTVIGRFNIWFRQCVYSANGYYFFTTNTAADVSLLIADAPSYVSARYLERSIPFLWSNSKILCPIVWPVCLSFHTNLYYQCNLTYFLDWLLISNGNIN